MDEMANLAGADPVAFRLKHLKTSGRRAVLEKAAEEAGWKVGLKSDGRLGRGVAFSRYENDQKLCRDDRRCVGRSKRTGRVKVERVTAAVDSDRSSTPMGSATRSKAELFRARAGR